MSEHCFSARGELDSTLAQDIGLRLQSAIADRGEAWLVVSGGSTPKGLFSQLARLPLPWSRVTVLLADDRWVPLDHEDCNEKMLREVLLTGCAADAAVLSLVADYPDEEANLLRLRRELEKSPAFDVVILGMGLDAHTASLFPCAPELESALTTSDDVLMTSPRTAPHRRVTLSRQRILDTRFGALHIVGDDKRAVLETADAAGDGRTFPIANFVGGDHAFDVYWAP